MHARALVLETYHGVHPRTEWVQMFERFTDGAKRALLFAEKEARHFDHDFVGTEHILLGLVHEGEGIGARIVEELGLSLDAAREAVEAAVGRGVPPGPERLPFTARSKRALELSLREALNLRRDTIGTEHLLLGLAREGEGVAAQILAQRGADASAIRVKVLYHLHDPGSGS